MNLTVRVKVMMKFTVRVRANLSLLWLGFGEKMYLIRVIGENMYLIVKNNPNLRVCSNMQNVYLTVRVRENLVFCGWGLRERCV